MTSNDHPILVSAEEGLQRLMDGNARFLNGTARFPTVRKDVLAAMASEQHPYATIIGCSDSRVPPELVFDANFGELFVIRVAGNVLSPEIAGTLQYAGVHLKTPLFLVLGHENCGAVKAALSPGELHGNLALLVKEVKVGENLPMDKAAKTEAAIKNNARYHADRLRKQSPLINDFAAAGRVRIIAGTYSLKTGAVEWLESPKKK